MENEIMYFSPEIKVVFKMASGLCWIIAYTLIIRRGFIDKTYGMPIVALCVNISWEFIFSFIHPHKLPQLPINIGWFLFDLPIMYQILLRGDTLFGRKVSRKAFLAMFPIIMTFCFLAVLFITYEFKNFSGEYTAFGQNFLMSVLFISLLANRYNSNGQSIYIAVLKMIGTIFPSIILLSRHPSSWLLNYLCFSILMFDIAYIVMLFCQLRREGINPWRRL